MLSVPWLFRLPWFRRFVGYDIGDLILVNARRSTRSPEDLVTHELTHAWQHQHGWLQVWLSYLWQGYRHNEHEIEAREAVPAGTRVESTARAFIATYFVSRYSSMPSWPPSRPKPDCLTPPNGAPGVGDHALVEADHAGLEALA